jgi:mono/diheme cytochrome c family protein
MKIKILIFVWIAVFASVLGVAAANGPNSPRQGDSNASSAGHANAGTDDPNYLRLEGERRYRANCGRCHAAPQKFPPRMMATIVRHMRVRATITDQDMKSILYYMTQ